MRRRDPYDPFDTPRGGSPWGGPPRSARAPRDYPVPAGGSDPFADPWGSASLEAPAPEGTLGTAVVAGLGLFALLGVAVWGLFGGPDLLGFLGLAFLPLALALLLTVASALDETRRRPLAQSAGALFALALLALLLGVEQLAGIGGLFVFLGVLAGSFALRPFVARLRAEAYLPPLASGWWIWSGVLAYAAASGSPAGALRVALVGYLFEWFGPALDRRTAATRERLMRLIRPREPELPPLDFTADVAPVGPVGAITREHREVARAIVEFVETNFARLWGQTPVISEVLGRAPKFTTYILKVPANVPADLLLNRSTDLATFLSDQRGSDGLVIRKKGFRENDVAIKSAAEKGGVRIEIQKPAAEAEPAWFEPNFRFHFTDAIARFEKPDQPQYAAIIGIDGSGEPVVAKVAGKGAQPHLLIAGATGSGKSYLMHLILVQLLLQYGPSDLRLAVIDPKRVGVGIRYRRVPHLLAPVASEVAETVSLMKRVHDEMSERYTLLESAEANSIEDYNHPRELVQLESERLPRARRQGDLAEVAKIEARIAEIKGRRLPVILFVIDEVSDFTDAADKVTTEAYKRYVGGIARKGRAAGILLIIGVQRPSQYNVGENIRNNLTQRIALQLISAGESEMILGKEAGDAATRLSPKGDGIYYLNGERSRFQALLLPDRAADRFGAGENHLLTEDYIKKIIGRWGGESEFSPGTPSAAPGRQPSGANHQLAAAHGPACDDREWLVIRGMALAITDLTDVYKERVLTFAEIVAWARRAAEEYGYVGPAMTEGEVERAIKRFYDGDGEVVKGGVFHASRSIVGPFTARGQTRDLTLVGKFGPAVAETPVGSTGRDPAAVIAEIAARRSRDA